MLAHVQRLSENNVDASDVDASIAILPFRCVLYGRQKEDKKSLRAELEGSGERCEQKAGGHHYWQAVATDCQQWQQWQQKHAFSSPSPP